MARTPIEEGPIDFYDSFETACETVTLSSCESIKDPIDLPAAPFAIPDDVREFEQRLDEALLNAASGAFGEDTSLVVSVERLPDDRYRLEIESPLADEPPPPTPRVRRWILLLRPDLDWCAEACDLTESYFDPFSGPPVGYPDPFAGMEEVAESDPSESAFPTESSASEPPPVVVRQREVRCRNTLRRIQGEVFAVDSQILARDGLAEAEAPWKSDRVQLAVDLASVIDERLFSRPTPDSPPPVSPQERGLVAWYGIAFAVGAVTLAGQALRGMLSHTIPALRRRNQARSSAEDDSAFGKDVA